MTGVLSARGYNIESLTVAKTLDPELSRMTIVVDVEDRIRTQVVKQMNKLINVLQATDLTDAPAVIREMVLVRVRCSQDIADHRPQGSGDLSLRAWSILRSKASRSKPPAIPRSSTNSSK